MLFYLNVFGNVNKTLINNYSLKYHGIFFSLILIIFFYIFPFELEFNLPIELNIIHMWDDFYEALNNDRMNDVYVLYISYYLINSFEFLSMGFLLLIASVVCVNLNKFNRNIKANNYYELLTLFDIFNDFFKFIFMRKQNLSEQNIHEPQIRIFKKKFSKEMTEEDVDKFSKKKKNKTKKATI